MEWSAEVNRVSIVPLPGSYEHRQQAKTGSVGEDDEKEHKIRLLSRR